jgi:hypothetical protein
VGIGTFSILELTGGKWSSPFNVRDAVGVKFFTMDEVKQLFKEYEESRQITLDPRIVKDIYDLTTGYVLYYHIPLIFVDIYNLSSSSLLLLLLSLTMYIALNIEIYIELKFIL